MADQIKTKKIVLVVEDDISYAEPLKQELTFAGYQVLFAKNGIEGERISLDEHPDVVLLDILMPGKDGMKLMETLRQDPWGRTVPIILLTNLDPDDNILKGLVQNQPSYYFIKNEVSISEVIQKVKEILKMSSP